MSAATCHVRGIGLWSPGFAGPAQLLKGTSDPAVVAPPAALVPARLVRRTSLLTRACIEVFAQAIGDVDPASVATVFGSAYGEFETLLSLLRMLWTDGDLSPGRFANSVYNTASGYLSIATSNRGFTTTITAGAETAAMSLVEAMMLLEERGGSVVVIVGDENPASTFLSWSIQTLAVALHLSREAPASGSLGMLSLPRQGRVDREAPVPPELRTNPAGRLVPLVRTLLSGEGAVVPLSPAGDSGWLIEARSAQAAR